MTEQAKPTPGPATKKMSNSGRRARDKMIFYSAPAIVFERSLVDDAVYTAMLEASPPLPEVQE